MGNEMGGNLGGFTIMKNGKAGQIESHLFDVFLTFRFVHSVHFFVSHNFCCLNKRKR